MTGINVNIKGEHTLLENLKPVKAVGPDLY